MEIIKKEKVNILQAKEGYLLKEKTVAYKAAYIDEKGNEVEEHKPYYFFKAYVPKDLTLEKAKEMYEEIEGQGVVY